MMHGQQNIKFKNGADNLMVKADNSPLYLFTLFSDAPGCTAAM
jgi:hypothetical protein